MPAQVQLLGQSISVGRPSGYVDPSRAQEAAAAAAAALQAFQVRNCSEVFHAGMVQTLTCIHGSVCRVRLMCQDMSRL